MTAGSEYNVLEPFISSVLTSAGAKLVFDLNPGKRFQVDFDTTGSSGIGVLGYYTKAMQNASQDMRPGIFSLTGSGHEPTWVRDGLSTGVHTIQFTNAGVFNTFPSQFLIATGSTSASNNVRDLEALLGAATPFTMVMVLKTNSAPAVESSPWCVLQTGGGGVYGMYLYLSAPNTFNFACQQGAQGFGFGAGGNVARVLCISSNGTTITGYIDNAVTSAGSCPDGTKRTGRFIWGAGQNNVSNLGDGWNGHWIRHLVFNKELSSTERAIVMRGCGKKYGITVT